MKTSNPFEEIAEEWREYRPNPSSELGFFLELTPKKSVVLDAGCAHGRNHEKILEKSSFLYAIDSAPTMVKLAEENAFEKGFEKKTKFFCASITKIPLPRESVDCVYCIAVLHHLKTLRERKKALSEFLRVLKKKGLLFVSAWNVHQKRFNYLGRKRDALVKWRAQSGKTINRFYHFLEEKELRELAEERGFGVEKVFFEKDGEEHEKNGAKNLCAVLRKK